MKILALSIAGSALAMLLAPQAGAEPVSCDKWTLRGVRGGMTVAEVQAIAPGARLDYASGKPIYVLGDLDEGGALTVHVTAHEATGTVTQMILSSMVKGDLQVHELLDGLEQRWGVARRLEAGGIAMREWSDHVCAVSVSAHVVSGTTTGDPLLLISLKYKGQLPAPPPEKQQQVDDILDRKPS